MTNYEKHRTEIVPIERMGRKVAFEKATNKITACGNLSCKECLFWEDDFNCDRRALEWADAEYIEPEVDWSEVPVDTLILVNDNVDHFWIRRYFAQYDNGKVYAFVDGRTSWTATDDDICSWNYAKLADA
jgi:hypothetical protein